MSLYFYREAGVEQNLDGVTWHYGTREGIVCEAVPKRI
jgi:hypothetical protein